MWYRRMVRFHFEYFIFFPLIAAYWTMTNEFINFSCLVPFLKKPYMALKVEQTLEQMLIKVIFRSFHFHGKTYWYCSVYYYPLKFLSAKINYALLRIKKLFRPLHSTFWEKLKSYMVCSWTLTSYEVIDILRNILVISLFQKSFTLHTWKFLYHKT
jgi:hypothetical protein